MRSTESLSLKEEADQSLAEARMILPGMQALLGFQTIAFFNERFEELTRGAQYLHLLSFLMIIAAIVLAMTPAALFRTAAGRLVTRGLLKRTTVLLTCAMLSLSLSLCLDSYVAAALVFDSHLACILFAAFVLLLCWAAWFLFPLWYKSFHIEREGQGRHMSYGSSHSVEISLNYYRLLCPSSFNRVEESLSQANHHCH